ncbi:hypothetical protein EDC01DRAFT_791052 [Geopyxis carbonaria]|nr:hypothetical protein EDC01DRAFT_791052 [Geopyxis carbonaria]
MLLAKLGTATPPINLRVILTHTEMTLHDYTPLNIQLYCDSDPDTTLAFRLRDWADMLIVHGMDSDTLAAIATGWSGESLGRKVVRCWYYGEDRRGGKMLYVQPMMEDGEWRHPVTRRQLEVLLGWEGGIVMGKNCGDEEKAARDCVVAVRTYGEVPKP